jgi:hypothetical protein
MSNQRFPINESEPADAIRRHLGVALDGFIASLLATIRPMPLALQPVAVMNRRKRQRLAAK